MALTLGDAILYLKSNNKGLNDGLADAERTTKGWASGLGGKIGPLIGGAVVGGVTVAVGAIAGIGTAAFNVSNEVDEATKKMQASLGITGESAKALGQVAVDVFANNFAGSITEAAEAVGLVEQQLGAFAEDDTEIQRMTENAFRLRDAFGVDVADGVSAAKTLMENFGVSSDRAFDLIAAGFQGGLNRSDDFLDTIGEYAVQFAEGGASAEEMFGLLDSGLQGGMLGTDKAADAFKEFRVRIADGSKTTKDALAQLGLSADDMSAQMADGTMTAADAFDEVIRALQMTDDPVTRFQAGVGLLGTQFEDLGDSVATGLDLTADWAEGVDGAAAKIDAQYNTLGSLAEGFKRKFLVALQPLGDELLKIANDAMPYVEKAFEWMSTHLPGIISGAVDIIKKGVKFITDLFSGELTAGLGGGLKAFQIVRDWIDENMPLIKKTVETILNAIMKFWDEHGETILKIVTNLMTILNTTIETGLQVILGLFKAIMLIINGDWEGAWQELKNIAQIWMDGIWTVFSTMLDSYVTLILDFGPDMWNAGAALIENLWNGLKSKWEDVQKWWSDKTGWIADMLPGSEPKAPESPLRGLDRRGEAILGNMQTGLDRATLDVGAVTPALGPMIGPMLQPTSRTLNITAPLVGSVTVTNEADEDRLVAKMMDALNSSWATSVQAGTRWPLGLMEVA